QQTAPHELVSEPSVSLPRPVYRQMSPALRLRWLMDAASRLQDPARASDKTAGWVHIRSADDVMMNGDTGAVAQLPGFVQVRLGRQHIHVEQVGRDAHDAGNTSGTDGSANKNPGFNRDFR